MGLTTIFTFGIGIPAGIYVSLHRNTVADRAIMGFTVASFSLPNFVVGILLILVFGVVFKILPTSGSETVLHYILPVATMATADAAIFARFSRSAMLEVLSAPFMHTARAKGLLWREAVRRHALPNASIPIVTVGGIYVGRQIAAATITENVFAWPGIGKLLVVSVQNRDLAVVQCIVILLGGSAPQVTAVALEEAVNYFAPAYRFTGEPVIIPPRAPSSTARLPNLPHAILLADEHRCALDQVAWVRETLARMRRLAAEALDASRVAAP